MSSLRKPIDLEIVPFPELSLLELAWRLPRMYRSNRQRIEEDFPGVGSRYGTFLLALKAVRHGKKADDGFMRCGILLRRLVIGLATIGIEQGIEYADADGNRATIHGTQFAAWTGHSSVRPGRQGGIQPALIQARLRFVKEHGLNPRCWTVIQVGARGIDHFLDAGFVPLGVPFRYHESAGNMALYQILVRD